ncbi:hypothetical protein EWF20_07040 [Sulfolobus sp. S-194]|uniref:hypothetical protein n=1 Tax=Sulfolobus sp. S-194 TaxID=2512240 RepID=UPI0014372647|nr:hypothetical protein [Sulfolobus sp. S-194]QIW23929.1 hypothetical protein EWF20_07040 [Sulfolobus sp. S-194]
MNQKIYVIFFRALFSLFEGFMSFVYVALMKSSGLNSFQVGLILTLSLMVEALSYVVLIVFSIPRNIIFSALLVTISDVLLLLRNIYGFILIAVISGISSAIYSAVIIIQKDFTKKDYSLMLGSVATTSVAGIGLYYLSAFIGVNLLLFALLPVLIFNIIISMKIKYEEPEENLKDFLQNLRSIGRTLFGVDFLIALRRTFLQGYISLILLSIFVRYTPQQISLYLTLFKIPTIPFLFIGHKISNNVYLILSLLELTSFLFIAFFYNFSLFIFLIAVMLILILSSLRGPSAEQAIMKMLSFSTKLSALFNLLDVMLSSISSLIIALMLEFGLYSLIILMIGILNFMLDLTIYKMLRK